MTFTAFSDGQFHLQGRVTRCALGRSGTTTAQSKREGDGASPLGAWPIRRLLYRSDRSVPPPTALPVFSINPTDGWCDAPLDPAYNRPVVHPYPASAEHLWREDHLYDFIVVLGHNDDPVVPGAGSAIFLHLAKPDFAATEGCVALARDDLLSLLAVAQPGDLVVIRDA